MYGNWKVIGLLVGLIGMLIAVSILGKYYHSQYLPPTKSDVLWTVISDDKNSDEILKSFQEECGVVWTETRNTISNIEYRATKGVQYRFVALRSSEFPEFSQEELRSAKVIRGAVHRGYHLVPIEAALLLREQYTQEQLGCENVAIFCESEKTDILNVCRIHKINNSESFSFAREGNFYWITDCLFIFLAPDPAPPAP